MIEGDRYHVVPLGDVIDHQMTVECECRPELNEAGLVVHNAIDNREFDEIARAMIER